MNKVLSRNEQKLSPESQALDILVWDIILGQVQNAKLKNS